MTPARPFKYTDLGVAASRALQASRRQVAGVCLMHTLHWESCGALFAWKRRGSGFTLFVFQPENREMDSSSRSCNLLARKNSGKKLSWKIVYRRGPQFDPHDIVFQRHRTVRHEAVSPPAENHLLDGTEWDYIISWWDGTGNDSRSVSVGKSVGK